jgi:hypothetical protein
MTDETRDERQSAEVIDLDRARKEAARRRRRSQDEVYELVARMNKTFAVVPEAGEVFVYRELPDPLRKGRWRLDKFTVPAFYKLLTHQKLIVEVADLNTPGKTRLKSQSHADIWFNHPDRRQCWGGTIFDPSGASNPKYYWQLWKGFAVTPVKNRQGWPKMQEHIYHVLAAGDRTVENYILNWAALMLQQPARQAEVALIFKGEDEGEGKYIFVKSLLKILGQHGLHLHHQDHLGGRFNAHLHQLVLLFIDEAFYAGDKKVEGFLKGIVSDDEIGVEPKNRDLFQAPNYLHIIMASNRDRIVHASKTSRRWAPFKVSDHRRGQRDYFAALAYEIDHGGAEAMLWDLLHRNISRFEVRDIPRTAELDEQRLLGFEILERWWMTVLERGFVYKSRFGAPSLDQWHDFHNNLLLAASHHQFCREIGWQHPATAIQVGRFMKSSGYRDTDRRSEQPIGERDFAPPGPAHHSAISDRDQPDLGLDKPPPTPDWRESLVIRRPRTHGYETLSLEEARATFKASQHDLPMPWDAVD